MVSTQLETGRGDDAAATGSGAGRRGKREPRPTKVRERGEDRVFTIVVYTVLTVLLLAVALPMLNIVASSFSSPAAVTSGRVSFWPVDFTTRGYEVALNNPQIVRGFLNSVGYVLLGTTISVALTIALAYPLSRRSFVGRNVITVLVIFTMLFSGGLIPTYMVVRGLGLIDTPWAMVLPAAVGVWQVIIARAYFQSAIPEELHEAAMIDGASDLRVMWSVVLPLAKPMIAVVALMYAIGQWNAYFDALIYLRSDQLQPLQIVLRNILVLNASPSGGGMTPAEALERRQLADLLKFSLIVISTIPVMIIYPFVAKHFTKGVLLGAVKG